MVPFWLCGSGADVVCRETAHRGHCRADRSVHSGKMFYSLSFCVFEYTRTAKKGPSCIPLSPNHIPNSACSEAPSFLIGYSLGTSFILSPGPHQCTARPHTYLPVLPHYHLSPFVNRYHVTCTLPHFLSLWLIFLDCLTTEDEGCTFL